MWNELFTHCIWWGIVPCYSTVDGDWLPATNSLCRTIQYDSNTELWTSQKIWEWGPSLYGAYSQKEEFEFILTVKMETKHPSRGSFGSEFPVICNHCVVMAAWSRKVWKICEKFLHFLEKRLLMVKFSKLCFESLHGDTNWRYCVLIIS